MFKRLVTVFIVLHFNFYFDKMQGKYLEILTEICFQKNKRFSSNSDF